MNLRSVFAANVKRQRLARRMSIEELAERTGFGMPAMEAVENGERSIALDTVERLARALRVKAAKSMK